MRVDVPLPSLGDDEDAVRGGTVALWHVLPGAQVREGDDLLELNTDKAAFVVPAPQAGKVLELKVAEGDQVAVGEVLCTLEV